MGTFKTGAHADPEPGFMQRAVRLDHRVAGLSQQVHRFGDLARRRIGQQMRNGEFLTSLDEASHQGRGRSNRAINGVLGRPQLFGDTLNNENFLNHDINLHHTEWLLVNE